MATEVTVPQLGESVTEGTITEWLVQVGDHVEADQPLFELSSDKVDTEVPAPASGVLQQIKVNVDETVDVGTVVAVIGEPDEAAGGDGQGAPQESPGEAAEPGAAAEAERPQEAEKPAEPREQPAAAAEEGGSAPSGDGSGRLMSPIVRRMVAEHGLDPARLSGSGEGGRITREDVEAAIAGGGPAEARREPAGRETRETAERGQTPQPERRSPTKPGERERVEDLSRIRQRIAAKMMESMQSSAQLTTVQEADVSRIMALRERVKDEFKAREGVSLSPFVFLCRAAVLALRRHEHLNAQADWDAGKVKYHEYVNLGIAVDTEKGLLVPNVKNADDLTLAALARGIKDAADKARGASDKRLEMQDIEGGTFTMTNTGSRGVLIDTPILNYPEVGILGTGAIQKRPVVIEDSAGPAIGVRQMMYLSLTYDHRLIDGADAARFVNDVAGIVADHDWDGELGY